MSDTKKEAGLPDRPDPETREAVKPVEHRLEEVLTAIDSPAKAEAVVERLDRETAGRSALAEAEAAPQAEEKPPEQQATIAAEAVERTVTSAPGDPVEQTVAALETAAAEAAALSGPAYEALAESVQRVASPALHGDPMRLARPRRFLRDAIMRRMSPFQKYDTALFLAVNNLPHTPATNAFFHQVSFWFNGGWAWILGVALLLPVRPAAALAILKQTALPTWVATVVVEGPIKAYFRRRRPFIDIVRAIVVGKKPGNWSFPSGHSASAFAGARMMSHCLPRWTALWYSLAGLVGFSRIYLGAHYPGDVLWGSAIGLAVAETTRRAVEFLGRRRSRGRS